MNVNNDVVLFLEIHGQAGTIRSSGYVTGIDKSKLKISIDFTTSWEALVKVEDVPFLDLNSMPSGDEKDNMLSVLNSNEELVKVSKMNLK